MVSSGQASVTFKISCLSRLTPISSSRHRRTRFFSAKNPLINLIIGRDKLGKALLNESEFHWQLQRGNLGKSSWDFAEELWHNVLYGVSQFPYSLWPESVQWKHDGLLVATRQALSSDYHWIWILLLNGNITRTRPETIFTLTG